MRVVGCIALCALGAASYAGPTGCVVIPIADILKHKETFFYYGLTGNERQIDKGYAHALSMNMGLFDRIEVGIDTDTMGTSLWHGKLSLYEDPHQDFGASIGWMNWNIQEKYGEPYVAVRYGMPSCKCEPRLHAGFMRNDRWRGMVGVDAAIAPDVTFAADWASGPNSYFWTGLTYNIARVPGMSVSAFVGLPAVKSDGILHTLYVNYAVRF